MSFTTLPPESRNASAIWPGLRGNWNYAKALHWRSMPVYKPLHSSLGPGQGFTVVSWDFPVLAKYHLAKLGRAPFVEAGPSFRVAGNLNGYNPSHFGVTAGCRYGDTQRRGTPIHSAPLYPLD